jgi:serine/threonine protein phosphatase PrpC
VSWVARGSICPLVLLYSDGVYEDVKTIPHFLFHIAVEQGVEKLVQHAIESGSCDNITAVMVKI